VIRFRHADDEKKYVLLRTEVARGLAGLPRPAAAAAMQAFAKLELLLQLEGVRQGMALASLSLRDPSLGRVKAFQTHANLYGSSDTPLAAVEDEWLSRWGHTSDGDPWLDPSPMRFAAQPVSAGDDESLSRAWAQPLVVPQTYELPHPFTKLPEKPLGRWIDPDGDREDDLRPESPSFLSNVRDSIRELLQAGWKPKDWTDLIMKLHLHMQVDAAFLDLQLSTEMGRTVIAQNGLFHVHPGDGLFLEDLAAAAAVAAHEEEGDANQGEPPEDNGSDPDVVPGAS
jgi:hypothetical protein